MARGRGNRNGGGVLLSFADLLKKVRRREGYSQATAAELVRDLSVRTLQAWECGQQTPPKWAQWLVLEALGGAPYVKRPASRNARPGVRKGKASASEGRKHNDKAHGSAGRAHGN